VIHLFCSVNYVLWIESFVMLYIYDKYNTDCIYAQIEQSYSLRM